MQKDGKLYFIILATLLITISSIAAYKIPMYTHDFIKSSIVAISYAFTWVVFAWIITDKCILRKPYPYILIFILFFVERLYWSINYHLFSYENFNEAYNFYMIFDLLIIICVFTIFWYLSKPKNFKDFNSFLKTKNMVYVLFAAFFTSMGIWLTKFILENSSIELIQSIYETEFSFSSFIFITNAIPYIFGILFLSFVITNIRSNKKYGLYGIIILFSMLFFLPFDSFLFYGYSQDILKVIIYFLFFGIAYFVIFTSLTLLSKTKYLD